MPNQELDQNQCNAIRKRLAMTDAQIAKGESQRQMASNTLRQTQNQLMQERTQLNALMKDKMMAESMSNAATTEAVDSTEATNAAVKISVIEARIEMLESEEARILRDIENFDKQLSDMRSSREANAAEATRLNCVI